MSFLKSISLSDDFLVSSRASHYRPTRKSLDIVRSVLGEGQSQATSVIASYGSGKSLAALVGGLFVEGADAKSADVKPVIKRLEKVDQDLADIATQRFTSNSKGAVITLSGYVTDLPLALSKSLGLNKPRSLEAALAAITRYLKRNNCDRLAIVWDEFGRHLERLVSSGRSEELAEVQELAEWAVRRKAPRATLTLLLHQNFQRYAGRLSQSGQSAWRKIEGRFETLTVVEDSDELYEFITELVQETFEPNQFLETSSANFTALARQAYDAGFFTSFADQDALEMLLERAWPLTPTALYLLPKVSSRVGQNERTVFSFLSQVADGNIPTPITVESVFTHFAEAMRQDTGPGGVHRRLVETESARARAETELEREILAAVCLLQLGGGGERDRLSMAELKSAMLAGGLHRAEAVEAAIATLLERKLLLYRRHNDDISVWHGADIDLRAKVSELMTELAAEIEVLAKIENLAPPMAYSAPRYNFENHITRYAKGVYVRLEWLNDAGKRKELESVADESDALVALVVDATKSDLKSLDKVWLSKRPHLIVALPKRNLDIEPATLELEALSKLAKDKELLALDPLIEREIAELKTNAFEYLTARLEMLTEPENGDVVWYSRGEPVKTGVGSTIYEALSNLFDTRFPKTPKIRNEQIVRRKVTAQTKSARKRCILGILERTGAAQLGYEGATSADASIFRTVFSATGLYQTNDREGAWANPTDLKDLGLKQAWSELEAFFGGPSEETKSMHQLVDTLSKPPIGLRAGVIPLMIAAGLKAFGACLAIRKNQDGRWSYVEDIQPSLIEEMAESPSDFDLEVIKRTSNQAKLIKRLIEEFSPLPDLQESDQVRAFYDAVYSWKRSLPPSALKARNLGEEASRLQRALKQTDGDPVELLFRAFPDIASRDHLDKECVEYISTARKQIEQLTAVYTERAIATATAAFGVDSSVSTADLLQAAANWGESLPGELENHTGLDRLSKGIISRARQALNGRYTEASFVRALSGMLSGKDLEEWDDATARTFEQELRLNLRKIEDVALSLDSDASGLPPFLEKKVRALVSKHVAVVGTEATAKFIESLMKEVQ